MKPWALSLCTLLVVDTALADDRLPALDPAIDSGGIVERRTVHDGVVTELYAGRVSGQPAWIWDATWLPCDHPQPAELAELRYVSVDVMAPLLARTQTPTMQDVATLPVVKCEGLATVDRFYSYAVMKTPPLLPTIWSLVENTRRHHDGGAHAQRMTLRSVQVAGSLGGLVTTTDVVQAGTSTLWQSVVEIRLGMPVPDAILDAVIPKAKAPPRRTLLERLRSRADAAAATPPPAP